MPLYLLCCLVGALGFGCSCFMSLSLSSKHLQFNLPQATNGRWRGSPAVRARAARLDASLARRASATRALQTGEVPVCQTCRPLQALSPTCPDTPSTNVHRLSPGFIILPRLRRHVSSKSRRRGRRRRRRRAAAAPPQPAHFLPRRCSRAREAFRHQRVCRTSLARARHRLSQ